MLAALARVLALLVRLLAAALLLARLLLLSTLLLAGILMPALLLLVALVFLLTPTLLVVLLPARILVLRILVHFRAPFFTPARSVDQSSETKAPLRFERKQFHIIGAHGLGHG
jgi:hypothetical protein